MRFPHAAFEVTYAPVLAEAALRELPSVLPHLVCVAVECPEEPYGLPLPVAAWAQGG